MRLSSPPAASSSSQHRPRAVTELPLSVLVTLAALAGLAVLPLAGASALPAAAKAPSEGHECRPVLSGLVQEIQSSAERASSRSFSCSLQWCDKLTAAHFSQPTCSGRPLRARRQRKTASRPCVSPSSRPLSHAYPARLMPFPLTPTNAHAQVKLPKKRTAPLPLEFEWFVEHTDQPGLYSIACVFSSSCLRLPFSVLTCCGWTCSASTTVSACEELATPGSVNPFAPATQRAFAPGDAAAAATACSPAHLVRSHLLCPGSPPSSSSHLTPAPAVQFRLSCTSCDAHEDSAHGCLVQSVSKGLCVELLPAKTKGERPHLGWGECVTEEEGRSKGWKGKEARVRSLSRQARRTTSD